ncbi:hypothetical protein FS837_012800 [Tulasnella sp. UAMH 9824]|nr:hypothetical protein FS837_012800 [Tulasnella sp. UAMH 9824]
MTSVQTGTQQWLLDAGDPNQKGRLICAAQQVFYTASILWGVIGPKIQFSKGGMQEIQVYGLVAGAIAPLLVWVCRRKFRIQKFRRFSLLFILNSTGIPPATGISYSSWFVVAFLFHSLIRTRYYRWWFRYSYITGAALQTGTMIGAILVFLLLQLPKSSTLELEWWGNTVWKKTADALGTSYYPTDPSVGF